MVSVNARIFTMVAIGLVIGVVVGFAVGKSYNTSAYLKQIAQTAKVGTGPAGVNNSIFSSLTATIQGKVTKVSGSTVSVTSKDGKSGDFKVSKNVTVFKFSPGGKVASPSSNLKDVTLNTDVLVGLNWQDNEYQVVSISIIPLVPPPFPPPGTPSAIKK